jgi:hypothetical protein
MGLSCECPTDERGHALVLPEAHAAGQRALLGGIATSHPPPSSLFIDMLSSMVFAHAVMEPQPRDTKIRPRLDQLHRRGIWPHNPGQILPHGPEATVRGLCRWFEVGGGMAFLAALLGALGELVRLARAACIPYVITSDTLVRDGLVPALQMACDHLSAKAAQPRRRRVPEDDVVARLLCEFCNGLAVMLTSVLDATQRQRFVRAHAVPLLQACDRALVLLHGGPAWAEDCASERNPRLVWTKVKLIQVYILMSYPALDTAHARKRDPDPPWQCFRMSVMHLQQGQRCTAPGCSHTFADAPAADLRWRAGCRRVRYCSRRCQRAAWAHPHAAHRQICAVLLRACVESGMQRTRFSSELDRAPPEFDMRLAVAVSEHCAAQARFEIETSREVPGSATLLARLIVCSYRYVPGRGGVDS